MMNIYIYIKSTFYCCKNLLNVEFAGYSKLHFIKNRIFSGLSIKSITTPLSALSIEESAFENSRLVEIGNQAFS